MAIFGNIGNFLFRGEVWQRLSGASEKMENTIENYRILVTKETPDEKVVHNIECNASAVL